jgi:2-deoxy-D-gluconate 3-dehydrogenase
MILDKFRIDSQVAVVTGGTKGIGRVIAQALAEAGADIAVVSRNPDKGIEKAVSALGKRYMHHAADLTDRNQTREVVPAVLRMMGDINILVNNSGIIRRAPAAEYSETDWDATIEIDLTAAFILCQGSGQIMLKKGKGKIINIASVLALQGGINVLAYTSA